MRKIICISHSRDLDGYASAAIVKKWFDEHPVRENKGASLDHIGYDYGKPLPVLDDYDTVIMVDISFPVADMVKIATEKLLIWNDHHVSAIKEIEPAFEKAMLKVAGKRDTSLAACELTWNYFFTQQMPRTVELLGIYDSWRNGDRERWDKVVLPFQFGFRLFCSSFETFPMIMLNRQPADEIGVINDIIRSGETVLKYQSMQNERACHYSFEKKVAGLRAICLNGGGMNSQVFDSVWDPDKYDIMVLFFYNGKLDHYTVSFYSTKPEVDCSMIAKSFGGGGHAGAAGTTVKNFTDVFDKETI